jgi:hypothetical protein
MTTRYRNHDRLQHARFVTPIAMIGFGSIGKSTLHLIERHIAFALTFLRAAILAIAIGVIPSALANDLSFGASRAGTGTAARGADLNQQGRQGYFTGIIVIGDQTFHYGSGMPGGFSIPYGSYALHIPPIQMRTGRSWGDIGPIGQRIGSVATVNDPGKDTGAIRDPLTGHRAEGIQIHAASSDHLYSHGCVAVSPKEWPAFKAALLKMAREQGPLVLNIRHDGSAIISPSSGEHHE